MKPIDWSKFSYKHNNDVFEFSCRIDDCVEIRSNNENGPIKITYRINGGVFTYLPKEYVLVGEALVKFIKDSQKERWEDQPAPDGCKWSSLRDSVFLTNETGTIYLFDTLEKDYSVFKSFCAAYEKVVLGK